MKRVLTLVLLVSACGGAVTDHNRPAPTAPPPAFSSSGFTTDRATVDEFNLRDGTVCVLAHNSESVSVACNWRTAP